MRGIIDTSVFIALEQGRPVDAAQLPEDAAVSVVTLVELEVGVHLAADATQRGFRARSLRDVADRFHVLPVDTVGRLSFAEIAAQARRAGRKAAPQDTWIAATARVHGVAVYTQDADFDHLDVHVARV